MAWQVCSFLHVYVVTVLSTKYEFCQKSLLWALWGKFPPGDTAIQNWIVC